MSNESVSPELREKLGEVLSKLNSGCKEMDVSVLLAFQNGDGHHPFLLGKEVDDGMLPLIQTLLLGDLDEFLRGLMIHAQKKGHSSMVLRAMGIPEK